MKTSNDIIKWGLPLYNINKMVIKIHHFPYHMLMVAAIISNIICKKIDNIQLLASVTTTKHIKVVSECFRK